jgi:hypothetical protein
MKHDYKLSDYVIEQALEQASVSQLASAFGRKSKAPICGHVDPRPERCKHCRERIRFRELRERERSER